MSFEFQDVDFAAPLEAPDAVAPDETAFNTSWDDMRRAQGGYQARHMTGGARSSGVQGGGISAPGALNNRGRNGVARAPNYGQVAGVISPPQGVSLPLKRAGDTRRLRPRKLPPMRGGEITPAT